MAIDAISREKAEALIREQLTNTIQQDVPKNSIVMQLGTRLANMTSNQTKIPVLSMLPLAYWVNGDTGMKQTSKQEWDRRAGCHRACARSCAGRFHLRYHGRGTAPRA